MRPFDPDGLPSQVGPAIHNHGTWPNQFLRCDIELLNPNRAMSFVKWLPLRRAVIDQPRSPVAIEEKRWIDSLKIVPSRIRPRTGGVLGGDNKITTGVNHRADHVEEAVMIADRRGENSAGNAETIIIKLARPTDFILGEDIIFLHFTTALIFVSFYQENKNEEIL